MFYRNLNKEYLPWQAHNFKINGLMVFAFVFVFHTCMHVKFFALFYCLSEKLKKERKIRLVTNELELGMKERLGSKGKKRKKEIRVSNDIRNGSGRAGVEIWYNYRLSSV